MDYSLDWKSDSAEKGAGPGGPAGGGIGGANIGGGKFDGCIDGRVGPGPGVLTHTGFLTNGDGFARLDEGAELNGDAVGAPLTGVTLPLLRLLTLLLQKETNLAMLVRMRRSHPPDAHL